MFYEYVAGATVFSLLCCVAPVHSFIQLLFRYIDRKINRIMQARPSSPQETNRLLMKGTPH